MSRKVDYNEIIKALVGKHIPKPLSGTLSGHAAGEPFDKLVYQAVKSIYPNNAYRQFEYLNSLFSKRSDVVDHESRNKLIGSPTLIYLLSRGKNATDNWSLEHPFEEKQNDTADIIIVHDNHFELIDVKTRNLTKKSQPPNIISAYKLARLCALIIDNRDYGLLSIHYIELGWRPAGDSLICETGSHTELFKINPNDLYINWAPAMQIQFHVSEIKPTFEKPTTDWPREYIRHFVEQARQRSEDMIARFVHPFEKYL